MNVMVVGPPRGAAVALARALVDEAGGGPVTLVSDDAAGLRAALDEPGLAAIEVLCADPASPAGCDDALVHRQLLHGPPAAVAVVVDTPEAGWRLAAEVLRRLPDVPFVVTGEAAAETTGRLTEALAVGLAEGDRHRRPWDVLPGSDVIGVVARLADLLSVAAAQRAPLGAGLPGRRHCMH